MNEPKHTPLFWTVTGRDFGRSIAWARLRWINPMGAANLRRACLEARAKTPANFEPKLTPGATW